MSAEAYYRSRVPGRISEHRYRGTWDSTLHVAGAWQPDEQHMAPVTGLIVHAVEDFLRLRGGADGLRIARVALDILGLVTGGETEVSVEVIRAGRTIELVEAVLTTAGRPAVRARLWRLATADTTAVAGGSPSPLPPPHSWPVWPNPAGWTGGYIASLDGRADPYSAPGRTRAWLRTDVALVADQPSSELARFVGLVDTANGLAVRVSPYAWMFPNVDLTLHLHTAPTGEWVGFDTDVVFGPDGVGLTSSTLYDRHGAVGRAEQILTLRPLR